MPTKTALVLAALAIACSRPTDAPEARPTEHASPPVSVIAQGTDADVSTIAPSTPQQDETAPQAPEGTEVSQAPPRAVLEPQRASVPVEEPEAGDDGAQRPERFARQAGVASMLDGVNDGSLSDRILGCESVGDPDGLPDWTAENPYSTASGGAQYLDGTWGGYRDYARAKDAPPEVQAERFAADLEGGTGPWASSADCWA